MSDFDNYPYTEFHELNLDPTLKTLKEDKTELESAETKFNGVGDTIDGDNKKLDDAKAKADGINQSADNLVNETNAKTNTINQKADTVENRTKENNDKIEEVNTKQEETATQADNSVSNAYYENELTPEELATSKKLGTLRVAKASATTSNEIRTTTPTGVLGNCVVWSSSPFTFVNTNPQILTGQTFTSEQIVQYQCAGSFFIFAPNNKTVTGVIGSNGKMIGAKYYTDNILITPKHLDFHVNIYSGQDTNEQYTVILPKTDSRTWDGGYDQFLNLTQDMTITTKQTPILNHVYCYYLTGGLYDTGVNDQQTLVGYVYNGTLTQTKNNAPDGVIYTVNYSDNVITFKTSTKGGDYTECRLYFVDLGEM